MSQAVGPSLYANFSNTLQINAKGSKLDHLSDESLFDNCYSPKIAIGKFGPSIYKDPPELQGRVSGQPVYGWKTNAEMIKTDSLTRIMILGRDKDQSRIFYTLAEEKQERSLATATEKHYWTPLDAKIYSISCKLFFISVKEIRTPGNDQAVSFNASTSQMKQWLFISKDNRSYPCRELIAIGLRSYRKNLAAIPAGQDKLSFSLSTPLTTYIDSVEVAANPDGSFPSEKEVVDLILKKLPNTVDWAASSNQIDCPLSAQAYEEPYFLDLNNKTYSKATFNALTTSILQSDRFSTLEDGTALKPAQIPTIKLYANLSLWKGALIPAADIHQYSGAQPLTKPFDYIKAMRRDIAGFSSFVNDRPSPDKYLWDGQGIYDYYTKARALPQKKVGPSDSVEIEDVIFSKITFKTHHLKCPSLLLRNALFENCTITGGDIGCVCCLTIKGSLFRNCRIELDSLQHFQNVEQTVFEGCTFVTKYPSKIKPLIDGPECLIRCQIEDDQGNVTSI